MMDVRNICWVFCSEFCRSRCCVLAVIAPAMFLINMHSNMCTDNEPVRVNRIIENFILSSPQRMSLLLCFPGLQLNGGILDKFPIMSGSLSSFSSAGNRSGSTLWVTSKHRVSVFYSGNVLEVFSICIWAGICLVSRNSFNFGGSKCYRA